MPIKTIKTLKGRIHYNNNWEAHSYLMDGVALDDKTLRAIQTVCIHTMAHREVQLPVVAERVSVPYSDMGHSYIANSTMLLVKVTVADTEIQIPLHHLKGTYHIDVTVEE